MSLFDDRGQMTVEFVVVFPVLLAIALVSVNVILFLSECSGFDRLFRQEVARLAPSPGYGQTDDEIASLIESDFSRSFGREYLCISVSSSKRGDGLTKYEGVLEFFPTLFGKGSLRGAFGVSFSPLVHRQELMVDVYKPGVLL